MRLELRNDAGALVHEQFVGPDSDAGKRCGIGFNPSGSVAIAGVKGMCAAVMHFLILRRDASNDEEVQRCFRIAEDHLEAAQMFAVKGIAHKERKS